MTVQLHSVERELELALAARRSELEREAQRALEASRRQLIAAAKRLGRA